MRESYWTDPGLMLTWLLGRSCSCSARLRSASWGVPVISDPSSCCWDCGSAVAAESSASLPFLRFFFLRRKHHQLLSGASPDLKLWGGQQAEPLNGVWRRSPYRGSGPPSQEIKLPVAERFLLLVQQVSTEMWSKSQNIQLLSSCSCL